MWVFSQPVGNLTLPRSTNFTQAPVSRACVSWNTFARHHFSLGKWTWNSEELLLEKCALHTHAHTHACTHAHSRCPNIASSNIHLLNRKAGVLWTSVPSPLGLHTLLLDLLDTQRSLLSPQIVCHERGSWGSAHCCFLPEEGLNPAPFPPHAGLSHSVFQTRVCSQAWGEGGIAGASSCSSYPLLPVH